ncbi:MAG TPA: alpha/beta fold hydrolase [Acidimicrobiales bacterium]|nr:alpha/beta fold hydrolase [Acidimicrobiales bacterium]
MASRVVLVHGFTQTSRCWSPFDGMLDARFDYRFLDAPGHGDAAHLALDARAAAAHLARQGGDGVYVGYSMGGRLCLRIALDHPTHVQGLVLVSASPGIADAAARRERVQRDELLADRIEVLGVAAFLDEWLAQPLFAHLTTANAHREERLHNTAAGLASSLRLAGTGAQEPLWDRLRELSMPVLVITGSLDQKYVSIGRQMVAAIGPNATFAEITTAGHSAPLEAPGATAQVVNDWLASFAATRGTR